MKKTALITGASHGIGYELAKEFAQDGYDLVIIARHRPDLETAAEEIQRGYGVSVTPIVLDLSAEGKADELFREMKKKDIRIDALVNNAGFGLFGEFSITDLEKEINMIHLNVIALTELTKLFLPSMLAMKLGRILNVSSIAGFMPGPFSAVYFASKAYVLSFSESLAEELKGTGVHVSILCPGATRTGFEIRSHGERTKLFERDTMITSPQYVAKIAYEGLRKNKRIIIPGMMNKFQIFMLRFTPRKMATFIMRKLIGK